MNRATSVVQGTQTLSFTHDALGRNLTQVGPQGTISYTYDVAGRRTSMAYPGGTLTINYDYDVEGNVTKIRENGAPSGVGEIGSASGRERGCQYVSISVGAVSVRKHRQSERDREYIITLR